MLRPSLYFALIAALLLWLAQSSARGQLTPEKREPGSEETKLSLILQGGDVRANFTRVVRVLSEGSRLKLTAQEARNAESVAEIYRRLVVPEDLWSEELARLVAQISRQDDIDRKLEEGTPVPYPHLRVTRYVVNKTFDINVSESLKELIHVKKQWGVLARPVKLVEPVGPEGREVWQLVNHKMEAILQSRAALSAALDDLEPLRSPELVILTPRPVEAPPPPRPLSFSVRLEGGDLAKNAERVLEILVGLGSVKLAETRFQKGDTPDKIYSERLGIPVLLVSLASRLNGKDYGKGYQIGEPIRYPDVRFNRYEWVWRLDTKQVTEQRRQSSLEKHWNARSPVSRLPILKESRAIGDGVVENILYGYELTVTAADSQALEKAWVELSRLRTPNVVLLFPSKSIAPLHSARQLIEPARFLKASEQGEEKLDLGLEASIGCYLRRCDPWQSLTISRPVSQAARVIVLDTSIDGSHPDLSAAIVTENSVGPDLPVPHPENALDKQWVPVREFIDEDHGTHLAGIIASRPNGFGLVGINPAALLESIDWKTHENADWRTLVDTLGHLARNALRNLPIVLFASQWELKLKEGKTEINTDEDLEEDALARHIIRSDLLLVASAGQFKRKADGSPDGSPDGIDLAKRPRRAPVNLGRKRNVIIVTWCEDCYTPTARIRSGANYSGELVHVAAPASSVFSSLRESRFGLSEGTSQAAAMTAGVVSAMVTAYDYYTRTHLVKRRLQVTSYPIASTRIAAGAVDLRAALLDPKKHYRIKESEEAAGEEKPYTEFEPTGWCNDTLQLQIDGDLEPVATNQIRRLQRREDGWIIYAAKSEEWRNGIVRRIGPGELQGEPCFRLKNGSPLAVTTSKDFILADNWK